VSTHRTGPDHVFQAAERKRLRNEYSALFQDLSALLYRLDPMGLNFEINPDEYDPEVGTILPQILREDDPNTIANIVRENFEHWFGPRLRIEGATYGEIGDEMLSVLRRYRTTTE
jgi:hypothetical protein